MGETPLRSLAPPSLQAKLSISYPLFTDELG